MKRQTGKGDIVRLDSYRYDTYNAEVEREQNTIGIRIAEARRENGLTLVALCDRLKAYGVTISDGALSKWETGATVPNAYQIMALCSAMNIEDGFRFFIRTYQSPLNAEGMKKVSEYMADLVASGKYKPEPKVKNTIRYIEMPVSNLPVSAGLGAFLDEGNFDMISFPEASVPAGAEFGIRVSGDSMEPVYHNGQIVWVQQCDELAPGEVGIFICDNEGYLKAYGEQDPDEEVAEEFIDHYGVKHQQPVMISYNQAYPPKVVSPFSAFQVVGRVL